MANTTFRLKRSSVAGKQPNTSSLSIGELAINLTDQKLYSSDGSTIFEPAGNVSNINVTGNATINAIVANGSLGTAGKVLTSNSIGGVYWSTGTGGGIFDANAQYTWTNTQTFTNTITFDSVINGTANSANYIGTLPAANVVSNTQLSSNLAYYTNTAGLPTVIYNNTANDVSYVNGVTAVNVVSNAQLSANLAHYTNTASFYLDTLQDVSAGGPTSGQILTWNSTTNQWTPQAPPTVVTGVTPGYYGSFYDANANQTISSTTSAYLVRVANTFEQNGITVVNNTDITFAYTGTYEIIYSIQFFNNDNAQQDINVWYYKNGNNNIADSDSKFTINGKSGTNKGKLIAVTPFLSTFNAGDYVRLAWAATATGVEITTEAVGTTPTTPVVPGVIVTVKQISNIISAPPGTNSQLIFNDSGISNATAGFTFNKTTNNVTIGNNLFVTSTVNASALTVDNKFIANSTYVYSNGMYFSPLSGTPGNTAPGSLFYDLNNHVLNVYNDTTTPMEIGLQTFVRVYNSTGSTITKGTAVYISGANSDRPTISKAISNNTLTQAKAVGVIFDDILATSEGFVLTGGLLQNIDTRNFTAGQEIYISATTAGALSNTDPSYPNYTAPIGYALNSALNGQIYISTENPSVNLPNTSIYISNGTGPIVSNNFQYDYVNNVLKVGNSSSNAVIGYLDTGGTTTFMTLSANTNASLDSVVVNYSLGTNASSDFAAYDSNGPASGNWIDMGINGVNWNETFWTINGPSDGYLYTGNSSLSVGTAGAFPINFFTGGTLAANERMRITAGGNVGINNTAPVDLLSINGTTYLGGNLKSSFGLSSNSSGLYHSGAINAASFTVGATFVANSTTLNSNNFVVNNSTLSSNGFVVNSTGAYVTGFVNATSHTTGTYGNTSTGGSTVNTTIIAVGNSSVNAFVNSTVLSIGGGVVANSTGANNAYYLGGTAASGYALLSGAAFTGNVTISGNLIVTGTTVSVNTATLDVKDINITVAKGAATPAGTDGAGITVDTSNIGWYYNFASNTWQSNVGITPSANLSFNLGSSTLQWSNVYANNIVGSNIYGTIQTISQPNITANSANYIGSLPAANVVSNNQLSSNLANYQTTAGLSSNVATLSANNSTYLNGQLASFYTNATNITSGTLPYAQLGGAVVNTSGNFTLAGNINFTGTNTYHTSTLFAAGQIVVGAAGDLVLANGSGIQANGTWGAAGQALLNDGSGNNYWGIPYNSNNATYLGTVAAASYVQNTDSRVLSGNLNFTGTNNYYSTAVYVGANVIVNTSVVTVGNSTAYGRMAKTFVAVYDPNNGTRAIIDAIGGLETGNVATNSYAYYFSDSATIVSNTTGTVYGVYISPTSISANSPSVALNLGNYGNTTTGGTKVNTSVISIGNSSVNVSINSTAFSGTANNSLYLGGTIASGYQTTAGLSANVATLTSNNATNAFGKTEGNLNVNSATYSTILTTTNQGKTGGQGLITPTNANTYWSNLPIGYSAMINVGQAANGFATNSYGYFVKIANRDGGGGWSGIAQDFSTGDLYSGQALTDTVSATWSKVQMASTLSSNVATLTANNASYLGGTIASSFVANTSAGLSQNTSGHFVVAGTGAVVNATGVHVNSSYIATLAANSSTYANSSVTNTFTVGTASYFVANGNFGINNSAPTTKLSVNGSSYFGGTITTAEGTALSLGRENTDGNEGGQINFASGNSLNSAYTSWSTDVYTNTFRIFNGGASNTQVQMFGALTGTVGLWVQGNTGIGNSAPTDKLSVNGTTYHQGNVILGSSSVAVGLQANGGYGTAGQVLTSNGTATYWSTVSSGSSYTFSTGLVNTSSTITVNASYIATISANNASYLGGTAAASYALLASPTFTGTVTTANVSTTGRLSVSQSGYTPSNANVVNAAIYTSGGYGGGITLNDTGIGSIWMQGTGTLMGFGVGTTAGVSGLLYLTSSNAGINNSAPTHTLSVNGTTFVNTYVTVGNSTVNSTVNSTSITWNSTAAAAITINKPSSNGSRIDISTGANVASAGFWNGVHFTPPVALTNSTSGTAYPRTSHYYEYTSTANPSDLYYYIRAGNDAGIGTGLRLYSSTTAGATGGVDIAANGNIGIGNTSPAQKLVVGGNVLVSSSGANSDLYLDSITTFIRRNSSTGDLIFNNQASSNTLFTTSGNERMRIDTSGNVGIGTTSPGGKLDVQAGNTYFTVAPATYTSATVGPRPAGDGTSTFVLQANSTAGNKFDSTSTGLSAYANNSQTFHSIFASNGNFGIGTSSPAAKLNIYSSTAQTDNIGFVQIENPTAANAVNVSYTAKNYSGTSQFMQWENNGLRIGSRIKTNSGAGGVYFTYGNDSVGMTIDSSGSVGIGTTSPSSLGKFVVLTAQADTTDLAVFQRTSTATFRIKGATALATIGCQYADNLAFETNASERMRIDTSGNVGIGTSSPDQKLTINSANTATNSLVSFKQGSTTYAYVGMGIDNLLRLQSVSSAAIVQADGANYVGIVTNSAERMRIDSSGRVGIGTSSPAAQLHIVSSAAEAARFESPNGSAYNVYTSWMQGGSRFAFVGSAGQILASGSTNDFAIRAENNLVFASGGSSERMRIDSSGNVGIGTSSPLGRLHINGGTYDSFTISGTSTNSVGLRIQNSSPSRNWNVGVSGSAGPAASGSFFIYDDTAAATRMSIDSSGNVGIGTTSPGYKLQVNGSFAATTKSFVIDHPTKEGMKLRYGSLEGPENGVYIRGKLENKSIIELPDYWENLIDFDTITVNITPYGSKQNVFVQNVSNTHINLNKSANCFFMILAERKDVDKLIVEFEVKNNE